MDDCIMKASLEEKPKKQPKISETMLNKQIVSYLHAIGCYVWRNNSGVLKSGTRFVRFGHVGSGDIIGITPNGRFISIENKCNGEPTSPGQAIFQDNIIDRGWHCSFYHII